MNRLLFASVVLASMAATAQIPTEPKETGHSDFLFVPVGIYYVNGAFVNADPVRSKDGSLPRFEEKSECFDFVRKAMLAAVKSGNAAGTIVGACLPVRRLDPSGAVRT